VEYLILFFQTKTQYPLSLPFHPAVIKLIEDCLLGQFPRAISNDKHYYYIKRVCKLACVNKHIQANKSEVIKMIRCGRK